jgi:ATP-dependent Lon protease
MMYEANKLFSDRLPAVPVRGVVFLPGSDVRVEVGRDFSKNAISEAENNRDGHVLLVFQHNPEITRVRRFSGCGSAGTHLSQNQVA